MNKSIIIAAAMGLTAVSANARLNGEGYYRIQNYATSRYVTIIDDKGWLNYSSSTAELKAIELWTDIDGSVMSDPATVMHIVPAGSEYNLQAQGTGVYEIISTYVKVREDTRYPDTYWAYGSKNGITMYLSDIQDDDENPRGVIETIKSDETKRNWYIKPISATDDESFFGIKPTVSAGGSHYASFYAAFPFNEASAGIEICYVTKVDKEHGIAVYATVAPNAGIAASVPVFIKTANANASANRVNIGTGKETCTGNLLKGTYFDSTKKNHENNVPYDKNTMRCLGVTKDGKIGFVTADYERVPRNTSYLPVDSDCPAELTLMTQAEYDNYLATLVVEATAVNLDKTEVTLNVGQSVKVNATVVPDNAQDKTVTWTSSNSAVATVDANGNITAVALGSAEITATCGKVSATCKVTVVPVPAESVTLSADAVSLYVGDDCALTATVLPDNATDKTVVWTSENPAVATVDAQGHVVAVAAGSCVVTATCGDASAKCTVTVSKREQSIVWEQEFETLTEGDEIELIAKATSGLEVVFTVSGDGAVLDGSKLVLIAPGEITVTATQEGNDEYLAAEPVVRVLNVQSGITDIETEQVSVSVADGRIVISGKEAGTAVRVYTMNGQLVYAGTEASVSVARTAGYLVVVGNRVTKITVK